MSLTLLCRDQAQQLWTETQGSVQNAHAQIQEKDRMLIMAKSQFDHMQQQVHMRVSKIKEQEVMIQNMQVGDMVLPSKPSIMARTQVYVRTNHQWPAHVIHLWYRNPQRPALRVKSQSPTISVTVRGAKVPPRSTLREVLMFRNQEWQDHRGLGEVIKCHKRQAKALRQPSVFENLTGEMNNLKQQKARSFHAQSSSDKSRSRDQAGSQDARPNRDSRSQKHASKSLKGCSSKSRASISDEVNLSLMRTHPQDLLPVHRVQRAQVGQAEGVEGVAKIRPAILKVVLILIKVMIFTARKRG